MKNIDHLFQEYVWECEFSRKLRPETIKGYNDIYSTFRKLKPDADLKNISPSAITDFFRILNERERIVGRGRVKIGVKKSTIATYWSKLNNFFVWLEARKAIADNPFRHMKFPAPVYLDRQFLKKDEVEKIFTAIYSHHNDSLLILKRNLLMFTMLLFCGLRREELLLLQVRDFDIERRLVTIRAETSKSGISRRIPLASSVIIALKDYLIQRREYTTQFLFVSSIRDRQFSYAGAKHLVDSLSAKSGVKFHMHQFRHTFATNFLKQSNNIYKLKELMGHRDIRMTAVYLRGLPTAELRGDVEKMSFDALI